MEEEAVPERLFNPPGGSHEEVSPDIPEPTDGQGEDQDFGPVNDEVSLSDPSQREIINGMLDDTGDQELEDIHNQQTEEPQQDSPSIFKKVILERLKGLHIDNYLICYNKKIIFTNPHERGEGHLLFPGPILSILFLTTCVFFVKLI